MKLLILVLCLIASVCAYHVKVPKHKVVLDQIKLEKVPLPFKHHLHKNEVFPIEKILKGILEAIKIPLAGTEAILDDYADQIFTNVDELLTENGMDPLSMPELHEEFNYTIIIEQSGTFDLTNGWLSDLSTMHRGGDVIAFYDPDIKILDLTVPIAFDDLAFTFDYAAEIIGLKPTGTVDGIISDLTVEVKLGFNPQTLVFSLEEFYITHSGNISVEFHGDALVDWLLNALASIAETVLKEAVLLAVEDVVRSGLNSIIDDLNGAIDGVINPSTPAAGTTPVALFFN